MRENPETSTGSNPAAPADGDPSPFGGPTPSQTSPPGDPSTSHPSANEEAADTAEATIADAEQQVEHDIATIAAQRDEYLDALRRLQADFENYRKRILRQQTEHLERAAESLVEKLLPVLDALDSAVAHDAGFEQVRTALLTTLEKEGLERLDPTGKPFDPNEQEAVAHEEGDGEPSVAEVMRTGYRWKGRLLRPAMVKVKG